MRVGVCSVAAPDGARWHVGRRWVSRRLPRWRRVRLGGATAETVARNTPSLPDPEDIAIWLAVLVGSFVVAVVLIPLLLFGFELVLLGVVIAGGVVGRALLGRPWVVQAHCENGRLLTWRVSGWRRSSRLIGEIATLLAAGLDPPADL